MKKTKVKRLSVRSKARNVKCGNWGGLFNKKRFEWMEEEKKNWLKKLTIEKSVKILESLTSPNTLNEFKNNFFPDNPVCLKFTLRNNKNGIASRNI